MHPTRRHLLRFALVSSVLRTSRPADAAPSSPPAAAEPALSLVATDGIALPGPPRRYGETQPGPILRMRRGEPRRIVLRNAMGVATSLDLQGLRIPPPLGGTGPLGGAVPPGGSADIAVVPADAGTAWYHPWILDPATDQTAQGLAGVLVVEEPDPPAVDAEIVAMLTDRWPPVAPEDPDGAEALRIDGRAWPRTDTLRPGARVRLRLVNASTRRAVAVTCVGTTPSVVAIDGQPSELFKPLADALPVGPGARFDLMFDLPRTGGGAVRLAAGTGAGPETILSLETAGDPVPVADPIRPLPPNPRLPAEIHLERATRVTLIAAQRSGAATGWTLNGVSGRDLPKAPLFRVRRGTPVTLALRNASSELVSFRVHGFALRLLHDLDDGWEPYWREAVLVPPGAVHHAAFLADAPGRWLIESPFFAQTAGGLRGWFEVT